MRPEGNRDRWRVFFNQQLLVDKLPSLQKADGTEGSVKGSWEPSSRWQLRVCMFSLQHRFVARELAASLGRFYLRLFFP
jgi:hypothetical protein